MSIAYSLDNVEERYHLLLEAAIHSMEQVIPTSIFERCLTEEIAKSNGLEGELSDVEGLTVSEIIALFYHMDLDLYTYYTFKNVIGYGVESDSRIYLNTKYLRTYNLGNMLDIMRIGSNLLHEDSHDKGFAHDFLLTSRRPNSISYILNRAYEKAFKEIYDLEEPLVVYVTPWYKKIFMPWRWFK